MKRNVIAGTVSGLALLGVYFIILILANGTEHAFTQFLDMWYLILPLISGFGVQMGLFFFIRSGMKASAGTAASTGGMTTGSMVACCVHHVTDIVPVLGATALGLFLLQYQTAFMFLGILSNLVGITMMLYIVQKHSLDNGSFGSIFRFNMLKVRNMTAMVSVFVFIVFVSFTAISASPIITQSGNENSGTLSAQINRENGLEIEASPSVSDDGVTISLSFTTHSGNLDYDFTQVSVLEDSNGKSYPPLEWDGPPPSGHHISGRLLFPPLEGEPAGMRLVMKGIYDVPERVFEWEKLR